MFDPYLQWALATGFAGYARDRDGRMPIGIELLAGRRGRQALQRLVDTGTLRVPSIYLHDPAVRHCTARIRSADFHKLRGQVRRMELGLTALRDGCEDGLPGLPALGPWTDGTAAGSQPLAGGRVVIGIVDDGCAFAHEQFRRAGGETRVRWLWCQDGTPDADGHLWTAPGGFDYGAEAPGERLMGPNDGPGRTDEAEIYRRAGMAGLALGLPPHGTRVMDLAAGRVDPLLRQVGEQAAGQHADPASVPPDVAGQADLVFVQMPRRAMQDASGAWLTVHVLDAVRYILARSDPAAAVVVNISLGAFAGPHDGSSLLEAALDELIAQHAPRLQVVVAAGNSFQMAVHAGLELPPGASRQLRWHVPVDDPTENFVEVWAAAAATPASPPGHLALQALLTPPGAAHPSPVVEVGHSVAWSGAGPAGAAPARPACVLNQSAVGTPGSPARLVLVAMAPGQSGFWTLSLTNAGSAPLVIHAYIERDDSLPGGRPRQALFVSDTEDQAAPVSPRCTLSSLATGRQTFVVGAHQWRDGALASFSASGPSRDTSAGGRAGPDLTAPGTAGPRCGLFAAGAWSGGAWVPCQGTSMAAPVVARQLANLLATDAGRSLDRDALIEALVGERSPVQHERAGWGRLRRGMPPEVPTPAEPPAEPPARRPPARALRPEPADHALALATTEAED
ncbi:MAG TPA: S8 family serine peptidase [Burkholderiaceae bacterium]|nr:S8 family serine peptidase [Burkholderiaceae bacterium]